MQAAALITAAGTSNRFKTTHAQQQKKELFLIEGKSVIQHTIDAFLAIPEIGIIVITYPAAGQEEFLDHINSLSASIPIITVPGGETRQDSVRFGLEALTDAKPKMVMIHDGARPWITDRLIYKTYKEAVTYGGAAPGLTSRYALKSIDKNGFIYKHHERADIIEIQTPQIFRYQGILKAHRLAAHIDRVYTDDTEIYSDWGGDVLIVSGDPKNIKITYQQDLE